MTDKVSSMVITGRRINGPESPEPLTGTSFADDSGLSSANDLGPAAVTIFYFAFAVMLLRVIHMTSRFLNRQCGQASRGFEARTVAARFSLPAKAQAGQ